MTNAINFFLLSDEEQNSVEAMWATLLASCTFPIQIVIGTQPLNVRRNIELLRQAAEGVPGQAVISEDSRAYATELANWLENWMRYSAVMVRYAYLVIPVDDEPNERRAMAELGRRCAMISDSLTRAGLGNRLLDYEEVAQLIYVILNGPHSATSSVDHSIEMGALWPVVSGQNPLAKIQQTRATMIAG